MNRNKSIVPILVAAAVLSPLTSRCATAETARRSAPITLFRLNLIGVPMQQVLLELPGPTSTYLAGEDDDSMAASVSDPVVFRYETQATIKKNYPAVIFINFDPESYRVAGILLVVDETIPSDTVIAELAEYSYRRERRRVENDDLSFWVTDEIDPQGEADVLIFPDLDLEVTYIDFVKSTSFDFGRGSAPLTSSTPR